MENKLGILLCIEPEAMPPIVIWEGKPEAFLSFLELQIQLRGKGLIRQDNSVCGGISLLLPDMDSAPQNILVSFQ